MKHLFLRILCISILLPTLSLGESLTSVLKDHKVGLKNKQGQIVIPAQFEDARQLSKQFVIVRIEGRWHFYNRQTKEILEEAYDKIENADRSENPKFANARQRGDWWIIDTKTGLPFVNINAKYEKEYKNHFIKISHHGLFGIVNKEGKLVVPIEYVRLSPYHNGIYYGDLANKRTQVFNRDFKPLALVDRLAFQTDTLIGVVIDKEWQLIDRQTGKVVLRSHYDYIRPLYGGNLRVKEGRSYGIMNLQGKVLLAPTYDKISEYTMIGEEMIFLGEVDGKQQLIGGNGKPMSALYDGFLEPFGLYATAIYLVDNKGLLGLDGKEIAAPVYKEILSMGNAYLLITKDNRGKLIKPSGKPLLPSSYDMAMTDFFYTNKTITITTKTQQLIIDDETGKTLSKKRLSSQDKHKESAK